MSTLRRVFSAVLDLVSTAVRDSPSKAPNSAKRSQPRKPSAPNDRPSAEAPATGGTETIERDPRNARVELSYSPDPDGAPDAGEVVWTWVPYAENDGRGKDRPVLVIGRESVDRVFAVRLTSKSHEGERDFLSIGSGPWDSQGRPSWVDVEQLYSVHETGIRREGAVLDEQRFARVADALSKRWGWRRA